MQMDNLLKQKPIPLTDERAAMFGLLDRFAAFIGGYRGQYASITQKMNQDLQQRQQDSANALKRLANTQHGEQEALLSEHRSRVAQQEQAITAAKNKAMASIQKLEEDVLVFENGQKTDLANKQSAREKELSGYCAIRDELTDCMRALDETLGVTWLGESKLENILSNQTISDQITSQSQALAAVAHTQVRAANDACMEVAEITASLPMKVIFHGKRTSLIVSVAEQEAKAKAAVTFLQKLYRDEQKKKQEESKTACKKKRSDCNNRKEAVINERDLAIQKANELIQKENVRYQAQINKMRTDHQQNYTQQEQYYNAQIAAARKQWEGTLAKCSQTFIAAAEEQFPAANMNAWMHQFWMHPRIVEDYSKITGTQMNVLLGMAEVDISAWFSGATGEVIKKVMTKYFYLFGTNKEEATKSYFAGKLRLPYCISIEEGNSLLISYDDKSEERAKNVLNAFGMRMLCSVAATMMRFQLFDATGIGAFGKLLALDPAKANNASEATVKSIAIGESGKVHSDPADISRQIEETKTQLDDLSAQLINYASLRQFNDKNPLSRQIYKSILMMNFPAGLTEKEIRVMNAMTVDCRKWGFSMFLAQPDKEIGAVKPELKRVINELCGNILCLRMVSQAPYLKEMNPTYNVGKAAKIYLYGLPDNQAVDQIAAQIRKDSVDASSVKIEFTEAKGVRPTEQEKFTHKADDGIVIPVGYLEGGQPFKMPFDDQHAHAVIVGKTGSGKTNLLHVMMTNMMLRYQPEEVMLYLIDFKYGLDFRIYTRYNLPNFKAISINNDPEFALAMLEHLEKELQERSDRMGDKYQKISEYNADNPNQKMNRIVVVIDELYELVKLAPEEIQKKIVQKIDSFVHRNRAFGIHMVICGQDLHKIDHFDTIVSQCATRLALHSGNDELVKLLMDEDGVTRWHSIDATDLGACVFTLSAGANSQVQHTVRLTAKDQDGFLRQIHQYYVAKKRITNVKVLLTKITENPNHRIQMFVNNGYLSQPDRTRLFVGDPISMERELNFCPTENVWLAGGANSVKSTEAAVSFMTFAAVSLLMEKLKTQNMEILCTNCSDHPLRSVEDEENDRFGQLTGNFPGLFHYRAADGFKDSLDQMLSELDKRQNGAASCQKPIWWLVARPELTDVGGSNLVIDLKELLQYGPKYNLHVLLWTGDVKQAQKLQLSRAMFKERVCLEMTSEESKYVNGDDLKMELAGYKAVRIGQNAMKFRIYDMPDGKWMSSLFDRLTQAPSK